MNEPKTEEQIAADNVALRASLSPRDQKLFDEIAAEETRIKEEAEAKGKGEWEPTPEGEEPEGKEPVDFEKRFKDSQRYIQELKDKAAEADEARVKEIEEKDKALKELGEAALQMPSTPEELEEWSAEFPKMKEVIETIAIQKSQVVADEVKETRKELEELKTERDKEVAIAKVVQTHKDFTELTGSTEFYEWAKNKPKSLNYEAIVYDSTDVEAITDILSQYKAEKGIKTRGRPKKSTDEAAAATSISSKPSSTPTEKAKGRTYTESEVKAMNPTEYAKLEKDIDLAQREGRLVMDISAA